MPSPKAAILARPVPSIPTVTIALEDLVSALDARAPFASAAEWDAAGLQIGSGDRQAGLVAVVHEITGTVADRLVEERVRTAVTYHPLVFQPLMGVTDRPGPEGRTLRLVEAGVAVVAMHTNWDLAAGGTSDALAAALRLEDVDSFADEPEGMPIGRVGTFTGSATDLLAAVADLTGRPPMSAGLADDPTRVAVVPGSGGSFLRGAIAAEAGVLVTGDLSHHRAREANDHGMAVVDAGHSGTERPGVAALYAAVAAIVPDPLDLTEVDVSPWESPRWTN